MTPPHFVVNTREGERQRRRSSRIILARARGVYGRPLPSSPAISSLPLPTPLPPLSSPPPPPPLLPRPIPPSLLHALHTRKEDIRIPVVLLGVSESGKSTILKNMKMIYNGAFKSEEERMLHRMCVSRHVLSMVKAMVKRVMAKGLRMDDHTQRCAARILMYQMNTDTISPHMISDMDAFWCDYRMKAHKDTSHSLRIDESTHFLDTLTRICQTKYVPTIEDILRCQTRTTTITETDFHIGGVDFRVIDMGGAKNEREERWMKGAQGARAAVFCVALSDYDVIQPNSTINRMHESIETFSQILERYPDMCLFVCFTKKSLFATKIKHIGLDVCFPEYMGGTDVNEGIAFILQKFAEANASVNNNTRKVYASVLNVMDPDDVRLMICSAGQIFKSNIFPP